MRYFLKIEDCDAFGRPADTALPIIAEGEYKLGVLSLGYLFDGARYSLTITDDCVRHVRYGDMQMSLEFRLGKLTRGSLKSGGLSGDLDVFTHELEIAMTPEGCSVHLVFSDGEEGVEKVVKNITAYSVK